MAITVASVISAVQAVFPEATSAEIVTHVNTVDRDLSCRIKLRRTLTDVSLTASDDEYTISEQILRVWAARYVRSAARSDQYPLMEISREELNSRNRNWNAAPDQAPTYYYLDVDSTGDTTIGFWPAPPTTTSGGYPKVVMEVSRWATLTSGDSLPSKIKNIRAYKSGVCFYYAQERRKQEVAYWEAEYARAIKLEEELEFARLVQYRARMIPNHLPKGGII